MPSFLQTGQNRVEVGLKQSRDEHFKGVEALGGGNRFGLVEGFDCLAGCFGFGGVDFFTGGSFFGLFGKDLFEESVPVSSFILNRTR